MLDPLQLELQTVASGCWELHTISVEEKPVLFNHCAIFPAPLIFLTGLSLGWLCELNV